MFKFLQITNEKKLYSIRPLLIYATVFLIGFVIVVSIRFWQKTATEKNNILSSARASLDINCKLYRNVLRKATKALNQSDYSHDQIKNVIGQYYPLLQQTSGRHNSETMFWLSDLGKPVMINQNDIEHFALNRNKFIKRQDIVDASYQSHYVNPGIYILCNKIKQQAKVIGNLCVMQSIEKMVASHNHLKHLHLHYAIKDADLVFFANLKYPLTSYFAFLWEHLVYLIVLMLLAVTVYLYHANLVKNALFSLKEKNKILANKLDCIRAFESEKQRRSQRLLPEIKSFQFSSIYDEDVDLVINYFHQHITAKKLKVRYTIGDSVKSRRFDVLLLQYLLISLLTESVYSGLQVATVKIVIEIKDTKHIRIVYSDNSYELYSDEITEQLKQHIFYIDKSTFNDAVHLAGGSVDETYAQYEEKQMEITLPCVENNDKLFVIGNS